MKKISTLTGIMIILAVAIIALGGVFAYEYFGTKTPMIVQSPGRSCIPAGGRYAAPLTAADLCCSGLVEQPTDNGSGSYSGTVGICVQPPKPITNKTAAWKTYTNNQYGFSFQYPSGIYIKVINNKNWLYADNNSFVTVFVEENPIVDNSLWPNGGLYPGSKSDYFSVVVNKGGDLGLGSIASSFDLGEIHGWYEPSVENWIGFQSKDGLYNFEINTAEDPHLQTTTTYKMLSTFKFIK